MNTITLTVLIIIFVFCPLSIVLLRYFYKNSIFFHIGSVTAIVASVVAVVVKLLTGSAFLHVFWVAPLTIALIFLIVGHLKRKIMKPLAEIIDMLDLIANKGDLTIKSNKNLLEDHSELGTLGRSVNKMRDVLEKIIDGIKASAENVNLASHQLSQVSEDFNSGVSIHTNSTEGASVAMAEMSSSIEKTTQDSIKVNEIATNIKQSISSVQEASSVSNQSLTKIVNKIMIINEIAQKTDLLAINAAIEAASAGAQGKGFSVVAGEVRKLAEESLNAAAEINKISSETIEKSENSMSLINQITPDIKSLAELVGGITQSSKDQNISAKQINESIQELKSTSHNASKSAVDMENSAENLEEQANSLIDSIAFFKTDKKIEKIKRSKSSSKQTIKKDKPLGNTYNKTTNTKNAFDSTKVVKNTVKTDTKNILENKPIVKKTVTDFKPSATNTKKVIKTELKSEERFKTNIPKKDYPKVEKKQKDEGGFTINLGDYNSDDEFERF